MRPDDGMSDEDGISTPVVVSRKADTSTRDDVMWLLCIIWKVPDSDPEDINISKRAFSPPPYLIRNTKLVDRCLQLRSR
jgi:hypothetical protein